MEAGTARGKREELQIEGLFSCLLPVRGGLSLKVHLVQVGECVSDEGKARMRGLPTQQNIPATPGCQPALDGQARAASHFSLG